ncbi:hypothetical protein C6N75_22760 [Streptomyces solincola]|uniref:DUF2510 domain-containing protein n=1 Tax=Streptomyces solincola TaxID=2100817 RepID=A0A2S9PRK9_9ACTN|nr:RDD family protein [Streptomyces solincola]PRH76977.1 hypothetical protein C6N75_22760 [Streptomyces solincola]
MSAPTPATGDGSPTPGYYPDPSIPGYIRFWNGAAWVPGTSRPAPKDDEAAAPPVPAAPAPASAPASASVPAPAPVPAVEETGPVFFDEVDESGGRLGGRPGEHHASAAVWGADASHQSGFGGDRDRRVSWGAEPGRDPRAPAAGAGDPTGGALPGVRAVDGPAEAGTAAQAPAGGPVAQEGTVTLRPVPRREGERRPAAAAPAPEAAREVRSPDAARVSAAPASAGPSPAPASPAGGSPMSAGAGGGSASWAQQVHRLAQPGGAAAAAVPAQGRAAAGQERVAPWKPPVADPFLQAAQAQAAARPAGLGRRLAARLVDAVVLGALAGAAAVPLVGRAVDHIEGKIEQAKQSGETVTVWLLDGTTGACLGGAVAVLLVLGVLYEALPTARWGRTLGKRLCGVEVRDIESHEPPAFGAALRRWLVYGVLGLLVVGVANVLWCLFDRPWRQCWHDKAAHTFVARRAG